MRQPLDRRVFAKGKILVRTGDPVATIPLVTRGTVRVVPEGASRSFTFGPGAMLGLKDVLAGSRDPRHASTATALDVVETVHLDARQVTAEIARSPEAVQILFKALFVATTTVMKTYEADSGRRRRLLAALAGEIDTLIEAEGG